MLPVGQLCNKGQGKSTIFITTDFVNMSVYIALDCVGRCIVSELYLVYGTHIWSCLYSNLWVLGFINTSFIYVHQILYTLNCWI
jgi:hypothetical protein